MNSECSQRPKRWLQCPPYGELVDDTFLPFKTPYDGDEELPESLKFTPEIFIKQMREEQKIDLGLIINLTFSTRYYDALTITQDFKVEHCQIFCRGHNEAPSPKETAEFIKISKKFIAKNPHKKIGVHCTHGFNRTGFMICSFLYEVRDWPIDAAISVFASKRPQGIYKQDYINKLFELYGDADDPVMAAPARPEWDEDDEVIANMQHEEMAVKNGTAEFFEGITEVHLVRDGSLKERIYRHCAELCGLNANKTHISFPGAQPVSMDRTNIRLLEKHHYRVSWKADGCRFMLYIQDAMNIFFLARSMQLWKVSDGLKFPKIENLEEHLTDTLLDGEMVLDEVRGQRVPRYLIYDVICLNGNKEVRLKNFDQRCGIIKHVIVNARTMAKEKNIISKDGEPFKVYEKGFFYLEKTKKTLDLPVNHEKDGLIFQPLNDPYVGGTCPKILKWKPPSLNSIDFKLLICEEKDKGCLPETYACLYVSNLNTPMTKFKLTKDQIDYRKYHNKIVECVKDQAKRTWKIIRERTDKNHPNSHETAVATFNSIKYPVTEEYLLDVIKKIPPELKPNPR